MSTSTSDSQTDQQRECCGSCGSADVRLEPPATPSAAGGNWQTFRIDTMDCAGEEADIRRALEPVAGIAGLRFQLQARTVGINASGEALDHALDAIRRAGFDPQAVAASSHSEGHAPAQRRIWLRLIAALGLAAAAEGLGWMAPDTLAWRSLGMALAATAIALAGFGTYQKGAKALLAGKLNIQALMTVAVSGAFVIGQWPEAAMVMALYAVAELIEARSVDRARHAIQGLLDLTPKEATVQQADGAWRAMPSSEVERGARIRIRPGERVPLDGVVILGRSALNQAPITGESLPVDKSEGDPVYAGTINQSAELVLQTTALASDTTLAHIIEAVERAQSTRAPTQRFVDRFAAIYTPAVFLMAVAAAVLSPWLLGWTWGQALYRALVLLVIACPCALVISTPVTVVSALAAAARRGILIKGGTFLEEARKLRVVAMDKTGTVTQGRPQLVAWDPLPADDDEARPMVAQLALSLAARSDHPVSQAIVQGLKHSLNPPILDLQHFEALPGYGVQGRFDGRTYVLGNHRLMEDRGQCGTHLEAVLAKHEQAGCTVTVLACDDGVLGVFAVADTVKPTSGQAVAALRQLGLRTVLLSGDNGGVAQAVGQQTGMDDVQAHLLPQDKLAAIEALRQSHGPTAMVGDGINDAPALARSDLGIAMGAAGTDTAMEAADVVIMNDDLGRIAQLIQLSRRTHAVLWQNMALALGIKAVFLVLAMSAQATMWMAVFADMGASLLVVANGLRLLRGIDPTA
ncbi:MAG: heavy metal translocating P-type ATPase [Acidobacteriota bacterium]